MAWQQWRETTKPSATLTKLARGTGIQYGSLMLFWHLSYLPRQQQQTHACIPPDAGPSDLAAAAGSSSRQQQQQRWLDSSHCHKQYQENNNRNK
jgi:hypothetical protein